MRTVRVGTGLAFWGDNLDAAKATVERGDIDYLCCDHLAELTMSILSKRMERDPTAGYTADVLTLLRNVLPQAREKGIRIITNAGGANPRACAEEVALLVKELGLEGTRIAVVEGDDLKGRIDALMDQGIRFENIETSEPLSTVRAKLTHANAYTGAEAIVEALQRGADIVICGRVTDIALYLGPLRYEFGWAADDWEQLAAGACAAHILECGAQSTGGLYSKGWESIPDTLHIGYPIAEVSEDGTSTITKPPGTGGAVTVGTVSEQMVYEILDPANYLTADVTADFSQISLEEVGEDQVRVTGISGKPAPAELKVNMGYRAGFIGSAQWTYTWPDAAAKARASVDLLEQRLEAANFRADETRVEFIGANSMWAPLVPEPEDPDALEVTVRYAARCPTKEEARKVFTELVPICNNGPAGLGGLGTRLPITELFAVWPATVPRELVHSSVDLIDV